MSDAIYSPHDTTIPPPAVLEDLWEHGAVGLHVVGPDAVVIDANRADYEPLGYAREEYVGHDIREFHADPPVIASILERLLAGKVVDKQEARLRRKDGGISHVLITSSVCFGADGAPLNTRCFTIDITERKRLEEQLRLQTEAIRQMETPICSIWRDVLLVPLLGLVDSARAAALTEKLLHRISYDGARFAILDLTGVRVVDTEVAAHLTKTAKAAALLGSQVIITGVGPQIAQTLVTLGVDLSGLVTLGTVEAGLKWCMGMMG
jgi:rsbT co-antagonist protein RsbR